MPMHCHVRRLSVHDIDPHGGRTSRPSAFDGLIVLSSNQSCSVKTYSKNILGSIRSKRYRVTYERTPSDGPRERCPLVSIGLRWSSPEGGAYCRWQFSVYSLISIGVGPIFRLSVCLSVCLYVVCLGHGHKVRWHRGSEAAGRTVSEVGNATPRVIVVPFTLAVYSLSVGDRSIIILSNWLADCEAPC